MVVVFAFGELILNNKQICNRALSLLKYNRIDCNEIFTQKSAKRAFDDIAKSSGTPLPANVTVVAESEYVSTLQIVKQFAKIAKKREWKNIGVVAHRSHLRRCVRDLKMYGFNVIVEKYPLHTLWYYQDPQWWVRSKFLWWFRELPLRLMPFSLYEKKCG